MPAGESRDCASEGCAQRGLAYVLLLTLVAMVSTGAVAVSAALSMELRRERERDLIRVGMIYANAIEAYHTVAPGGVRHHPASLEDLLIDTRFPGTVRHLRRLYTDPVGVRHGWDVVRGPDGNIRGVRSTSAEAPLRRQPLVLGSVTLPVVERYTDWIFAPRVLQ